MHGDPWPEVFPLLIGGLDGGAQASESHRGLPTRGDDPGALAHGVDVGEAVVVGPGQAQTVGAAFDLLSAVRKINWKADEVAPVGSRHGGEGDGGVEGIPGERADRGSGPACVSPVVHPGYETTGGVNPDYA